MLRCEDIETAFVGGYAPVGRMVWIGVRCIRAVTREVPSRLYGPVVLDTRGKAQGCEGGLVACLSAVRVQHCIRFLVGAFEVTMVWRSWAC